MRAKGVGEAQLVPAPCDAGTRRDETKREEPTRSRRRERRGAQAFLTQEPAAGVFVRSRYEYAINEDARRAQLARMSPPRAQKFVPRTRRRAAADAAPRRAAGRVLAGVEAAGLPSSLDTMEAPLDLLLKFGDTAAPANQAPHLPPDMGEEVPMSTTEAARLRIRPRPRA